MAFQDAFRAGSDMGVVERQANQHESSNQVTQSGGQFVPDDVLHEGEVATHDHGEGEQEHVDDGVLEAHEEEEHDRHPHCGHLAGGRGGDHGPDHTHGDHPVAEHAADENGEPAVDTVSGITEGTRFTDCTDLFCQYAAVGVKAVGQDKGDHKRGHQCPGEVTDEDQAPVAHHLAKGDAGTLVDERQMVPG